MSELLVYHNPVHRGFFPDPSIIRVGEDYYTVNSTFQYFPAIVISHSKDLVHWEIVGHAITSNDDLDLSNIPDSHGIWAPDISYHEGKGPSTTQVFPKLSSHPFEEKNVDDFDGETLDLNWQWVRNPDNSAWSLTERPGIMRLWTRDGQLLERRAKNTLLRREEELSYTASTKLEFNPTKDGEEAGLTCYYSTATYVRWSLCYEEGRKLQLVINRNQGEEVMATIDHAPEGPIYLRVEVDKLTRSFYYSVDGEEWILGGILKNCIYLCNEGVPEDRKRHTGTLVGIYANNGGCGSRIAADFDFFSYENRGDLYN